MPCFTLEYYLQRPFPDCCVVALQELMANGPLPLDFIGSPTEIIPSFFVEYLGLMI